MKSFNEVIDAKLATLRRQLDQTRAQISALETYRKAGRTPPKPASKPATKPAPKTKPTKQTT